MNEQSEKQAAEELYAHRHDEGEWSEEAVEIETRPTRSEVISFRLPSEEISELEAAAKSAGESLSAFIRQAIEDRIQRNRSVSGVMLVSSYLAVWGSGIDVPVNVTAVDGTERKQIVNCLPLQGTLPV
jgi:hypothetical protein